MTGDALELTVPGPEGERAVRVSNPDKVYFPERGITKRQVVEYYLAVSEPLLGVLAQRPVTLKRFVDGVTGAAFYAKRVPRGAPAWVGHHRAQVIGAGLLPPPVAGELVGGDGLRARTPMFCTGWTTDPGKSRRI